MRGRQHLLLFLPRRSQNWKINSGFVLALASSLKYAWHVVYMDNLFSTINTFTKLLSMKIYAAGTCRDP